MAEADGTSSGGGSTWYYAFSYTGDGITDIFPLYTSGSVAITPVDEGLDLSIWGIVPPPTHMLGVIPLHSTGSAVSQESGSITLFTSAPIPGGVTISDAITLFVEGGAAPSPVVSPGLGDTSVIYEHEFFPEAPPAITAEFDSGGTVTLILWTAEGHVVTITSGNCNEVGDTGVYSWSTGNITVLPAVSMQYTWRMTDGVETKYGHFRLRMHEAKDGRMPRPGEEDSFIIRG